MKDAGYLPPMSFALDDAAVQALGEGRALVHEAWLDPQAVLAAREALRGLHRRGLFSPAHVGRGADRRLNPTLRGDSLLWLDAHHEDPALAPLWPRFEALRLALNEQAWLGLRAFELQAALYPPGAAYQQHLDAFVGQHNRVATAICYLNPDWRPEDGGALRVQGPEGPQDIAPLGGRLLVFLSARLPHEVLPCKAERWAVTAWFRGREDLPVL